MDPTGKKKTGRTRNTRKRDTENEMQPKGNNRSEIEKKNAHRTEPDADIPSKA